MPDPIRFKNKEEIFVEATLGRPEDKVRFNLIIDAEKRKTLNENQMREFLKEGLSKVSPKPVSSITYHQASFRYSDPDALKDFDFGNILVEAHLPYCLHLPNNYEIEVTLLNSNNEKALIIPTKIWTSKASKDEEKSDEVDFFADDRVVYFNKSVIVGPKAPIRPEEGWEQNFTGRNIEKIKEQNGVFRYSRIYIQFNLLVPIEKLNGGEETKKALEDVRERSLGIVNQLIDCYRFITKQEYIQRLGSLNINMIYFIDHQKGFYTLSSGFGIETAPINRSKKEIEEIERMLNNGEKPDLYNLLLLDAQSSFINRKFSLAVLQSFQALEIFLENFLLEILKNRGDSDQDCTAYLDNRWRTKERLKDCMKELKNTSLSQSDNAFWSKWCVMYEKTRNEIIHKGKEPTEKEVDEALNANIKVINWLKSI